MLKLEKSCVGFFEERGGYRYVGSSGCVGVKIGQWFIGHEEGVALWLDFDIT